MTTIYLKLDIRTGPRNHYINAISAYSEDDKFLKDVTLTKELREYLAYQHFPADEKSFGYKSMRPCLNDTGWKLFIDLYTHTGIKIPITQKQVEYINMCRFPVNIDVLETFFRGHVAWLNNY